MPARSRRPSSESQIGKLGMTPPVFVSPNVPGIPADNNPNVFAAYEKAMRR